MLPHLHVTILLRVPSALCIMDSHIEIALGVHTRAGYSIVQSSAVATIKLILITRVGRHVIDKRQMGHIARYLV